MAWGESGGAGTAAGAGAQCRLPPDSLPASLAPSRRARHSDATRGYDHGVFVPLAVTFPTPAFPIVTLSILSSMDPEEHLALGRALAPLRDENTLILGSGMSYHNMGGLMSVIGGPGGAGSVKSTSESFDGWLTETLTSGAVDAEARAERLRSWAAAPGGRASHPREEHFLPALVAAGRARRARAFERTS